MAGIRDEIVVAQRHAYYLKNKDRIQNSIREWRIKNKDREKLVNKKWQGSHYEYSRWLSLRDRSNRNGAQIEISPGDFIVWYKNYPKVCAYCDLVDLSLDDNSFHPKTAQSAFTIDKKDPTLPYSADNMVLACWRCNKHKSNYFTSDEWREIAQKYVKPKWVRKLEGIKCQ